MRWLFPFAAVLCLAGSAPAQPAANLLRNGTFQDDWITHLPETKNHHWCYSSEFYNRRDFNPDGWTCKGSWRWLDADKPAGSRRLVLRGPGAEVVQRVNLVAVHDSRQLGGFPDAGGFPTMKAQRSPRPLALVRDLSLRVRLKGQEVPADAGGLELALCPVAGTSTSDPMGTLTAPTASATVAFPAGSYKDRWLEVKLAAADWLRAVKADPKEGPDLPAAILVALRYRGKAGEVEIERAELTEASPTAPNLLANGGFEQLDGDGYPDGWGRPVKYRYFPPGHYYIFNTWHNADFDNRGPVTADDLIVHGGARSLKMVVAAGDEKAVHSPTVVLNQKEPRLIEVRTWVKTDRLCMLQIDAVNEKGERLDGFNFIHKAPVSIGTDDWRLLRQVFRPRAPVQSLRLMLCARGVNGYTLDDTGTQPQNNVVGTVWWDDVTLTEPESTAEELKARGVKPVEPVAETAAMHVEDLDLGERLLGENELRGTIVNPGPAAALTMRWEFTSPSGQRSSATSPVLNVAAGGRAAFRVPYRLTEPCPAAYTEYRGTLALLDGGKVLRSSDLWFGTWTTPIKLELGALYLRPEQRTQLVRMNLGFSARQMAALAKVRLELRRRGSGKVLHTMEVPATLAAVTAQREKVPADLREDFANLLLADLDVSALPVQPFHDPQRNWLVRATALDAQGKVVGVADSAPFCRQAHEPAQAAVQTVTVKGNLLLVNGQPWLPWGACYGHVPVYDGPADPGAGKYRDLHNIPGWNLYDRFTAEPYSRARNDFNCLRYVAGSLTDPKLLEKHWKDDNLRCSTAFAAKEPVFSVADLEKGAGGKAKLDALLAAYKTSPAVVSVAPGIEEAFGLFQSATPKQIDGMAEAVAHLRKATGKPVMLGHGGFWNRFEFEKVPFFDIYDPETEPWYPANLHTDLRPLLKGKDKVIWLRPQMYEDVPYERWRYHTYVELMRGCRGWQFAHGPGDQSLFRGLHGELEYLRPALASADAGPAVKVQPWVEHWSRRQGGKTYIIAATTHGIPLGTWRWDDSQRPPAGRARKTEAKEGTAGLHGIDSLPDARAWPAGTKLVQWVRLDPDAPPRNLVVFVRGDGRWTHAASWGKFDPATLQDGKPRTAAWFLRSFYRNAPGFLGWDDKLVPTAQAYIPQKAADLGMLPKAGEWVKLEVPLEKLGVGDRLLDGVAFLHDGGRVWWGQTTLAAPDGPEMIVWGKALGLPPEQRARVKVAVAGLKAGARVRVLFEDRELTAGDGFFEDDFRGQDLYQRFSSYGDEPVAVHIYEVEGG